VDIEQDASRVYDFMRQIEEQPKWNAGVKLSQVIGRVNQTTTHVKQVSVCHCFNKQLLENSRFTTTNLQTRLGSRLAQY
jgi:redox-sensitive bicupin YhaK (pirin superfamily)